MYMDQTFDDRNTTAPDQGAASSRDSDMSSPCCGEDPGGNNAGGSGGDLLSCLPLPTSCMTVLRKLRAPAISIRYSLDKQIIPDLDATRTQASGGDANPSDTSSESAQPGSSGSSSQNTTSESGNLTVRFFDVAVGGVLIAVGVCMLKCCCGMKRMCRRWF